jgi:hypothetical protein
MVILHRVQFGRAFHVFVGVTGAMLFRRGKDNPMSGLCHY